MSTHMIRRHYLHFLVNGTESDGLDLQQQLSNWEQHALRPELDQMLKRCVPEHSQWSIERLDIDVGIVSFKNWQEELPALIGQALEKVLQGQTTATDLNGQTTGETLAKQISNLTSPANVSLPSIGIHKQSPWEYREQAWAYFLTTGSLPWGFLLPTGHNLEQLLLEVWQDYPSQPISSPVLTALLQENARARLIRQFTPLFLAICLERFSPTLKKQWDVIRQKLHQLAPSVDVLQALLNQLWQTLFSLFSSTQTYTEAQIVSMTWNKLPITLNLNQQQKLANKLEWLWPGITDDIKIQQLSPASGFAQPSAQNTSISDHAKQQTDISKQPAITGEINTGNLSEVLHPDAKEGIYIENAGLVLLHPFLPQFFTALHIANEDGLLQGERALCLLHYLCTGQESAPEYHLVLAKLLCNIPLTLPIQSDLSLTDDEKAEAIALLTAVIGHWDALKNTGVDGLRGTFLLRPGKISLREDGDWQLQVEGKAYDILLEQLPWGIGMIKLPWMQRMLWVDWGSSSPTY